VGGITVVVVQMELVVEVDVVDLVEVEVVDVMGAVVEVDFDVVEVDMVDLVEVEVAVVQMELVVEVDFDEVVEVDVVDLVEVVVVQMELVVEVDFDEVVEVDEVVDEEELDDEELDDEVELVELTVVVEDEDEGGTYPQGSSDMSSWETYRLRRALPPQVWVLLPLQGMLHSPWFVAAAVPLPMTTPQ
jgi:hypothetical protein